MASTFAVGFAVSPALRPRARPTTDRATLRAVPPTTTRAAVGMIVRNPSASRPRLLVEGLPAGRDVSCAAAPVGYGYGYGYRYGYGYGYAYGEGPDPTLGGRGSGTTSASASDSQAASVQSTPEEPAAAAAAAAVQTPAPAAPAREGAIPEKETDAFPMTGAAQAVPATPAKKKGPSRPFIPALDSTRFFLISYIAVGHFIACCTKNPLALALLSQVNVVVGAFFVLSGYVVAYTCTELGKYEASARIKPAPQFVASRIMGYYPLYLLAQCVFAPVFLFADVTYNGPIAAAWHGLLTTTLSQAWFPAHAELWNAPTWFLSALTFATVCLPFALPAVASWRRRGLKRAMWILTAVSVLAKLAYSYDTNGWFFMEGTMSPRSHPSWLFWNSIRFSPFAALVEILIGCVAARLVMVRECKAEDDPDGVGASDAAKLVLGGSNGLAAQSPAIPALGMAAVIIARAFGWLRLNDALTRGLIFIPLFTAFVMRVHRQTVYADLPNAGRPGYNSFSKALGAKWLTYLGAISFPIYILHGPIGQIFYKRVVAQKLWGKVFTADPWFFPVYLAIVLVAAALTHELFMKNKDVQGWFQAKGRELAALF